MLSFPLAFLLLMVPPPALLFNQIALPLQLFASQVAEVALRAGGVPILRDGKVLELVGRRLEVAEVCSGIRSIVALFAFALALGHVSGGGWPRQVSLIAATVPIAILANAGRVIAKGFAAQLWGPAVADGVLRPVRSRSGAAESYSRPTVVVPSFIAPRPSPQPGQEVRQAQRPRHVMHLRRHAHQPVVDFLHQRRIRRRASGWGEP